MSGEITENVRRYRRVAGFSQEELAEHAALSVSTIRKIESSGSEDVRLASLRRVASALGVRTSDLLGSDAPPKPVGRAEPNKNELRAFRRVLEPVVSLSTPNTDHVEEAPSAGAVDRETRAAASLYFSADYTELAAKLPTLLTMADRAVACPDGDDERRKALLARSNALQLTGRYLAQVRQHDLGYVAASRAVDDARAADDTLAAAAHVRCLSMILLRSGRPEDAEQAAVHAMDAVEPKYKDGSERHAVWGGLAMSAAAAAIRNARTEEAAEYRRAVNVAATRLGRATTLFYGHRWDFGPVTAALKAAEDYGVTEDWPVILRRLDEVAELNPKNWPQLGAPGSNDLRRHHLDIARAHVETGDPVTGMEVLSVLHREVPAWLAHQSYAADTMEAIMRKRKRTLTPEMREVGAFLGVAA